MKAGEQADSTGAAPKTLQFEVQTLGTFLKHGLRLKFISENPASDVRPVRVSEKVPVYLEEQEITALLNSARTFDQWSSFKYSVGPLLHDIIVTYLKTGMRLEELRTLEWNDVNLQRAEISIRLEKIVRCHRAIPLAEETVNAVRELTPDMFESLDVAARRKMLGNTNYLFLNVTAKLFNSTLTNRS